MQHIHSHHLKQKWESVEMKIYRMEVSGISPNTTTAEQQGCKSICRPQRTLGFISAVLENSRPWETAQWSIQKPLDIWPPGRSASLPKLSLSLSGKQGEQTAFFPAATCFTFKQLNTLGAALYNNSFLMFIGSTVDSACLPRALKLLSSVSSETT